ncbi:MAG: hypothetical protein ACI9HX_000564 [Pseudoalteromonas tetraodonis]|jgi:hypothetical protein
MSIPLIAIERFLSRGQPTELDKQLVNLKADDFVATEFNVGEPELSAPNFHAIEARLAALY